MTELERALWKILVRVHVRARTGGHLPKRPADWSAHVRPFLESLRGDHQAVLGVANLLAQEREAQAHAVVDGDADE